MKDPFERYTESVTGQIPIEEPLGSEHICDIVKKDFRVIPYFVGVYQGRYFVSEEVPEDFRTAWIVHEIYCSFDSNQGHCRSAIVKELPYVGSGREREYLNARVKFFEKALELAGKQPQLFSSDFVSEGRNALDKYQELLRQYQP